MKSGVDSDGKCEHQGWFGGSTVLEVHPVGRKSLGTAYQPILVGSIRVSR